MNFKNLFHTLVGDTSDLAAVKVPNITFAQNNQPYTERELMEMESKIGAKLFGPVPAGRRREFFCLDENSWIWYEEWKESGKIQKTTVRYEIQPAGVLKIQHGARYSYLEGAELKNFISAVKAYHDTVLPLLYHVSPATA